MAGSTYEIDTDSQLASIRAQPINYTEALNIFDPIRKDTERSRSGQQELSDLNHSALVSCLYLARFETQPKIFEMLLPQSTRTDETGSKMALIRTHKEFGYMFACVGDYPQANAQFNKAFKLFDDRPILSGSECDSGVKSTRKRKKYLLDRNGNEEKPMIHLKEGQNRSALG